MQRQVVVPIANYKTINKWLNKGYEIGYTLSDKLVVLNLIRPRNMNNLNELVQAEPAMLRGGY
jgi:hypothetical protein